jgi:hypothetical protein
VKYSHQLTIFAMIFSRVLSGSAYYQSEEDLSLDLSRDFGYSSGTGRIQGTFSMRVRGHDNLVRVEFFLDDTLIGETNEPPYRFQFKTDTYTEGIHTLSAIGYTSDGRMLTSNERRVEFVSPQEGPQQVFKIILPIFALIFILAAISVLIPTITGRGKRSNVSLGSPRSYGISGGAI